MGQTQAVTPKHAVAAHMYAGRARAPILNT